MQGTHVPPFIDWTTAATNIQDAIDNAISGDLILVSNGVYRTGGKVMVPGMTNRVALDKALTVRSVNGPAVTTILARLNPDQISIRCAWLTNGAVLSGFRCLSGMTALSGDSIASQSGGNIWCSDTTALVTNCVLYGGTSTYDGAGIYRGTLKNSEVFAGTISGPGAGAGASRSILINSLVFGNHAFGRTGGTFGCILTNCTVTQNTGGSYGGSEQDSAYNCIVYFNTGGFAPNYSSLSSLRYCCSTPLPFGSGNFANDPSFVDGFHISAASPCRAKANQAYVSGLDVDGQSWASHASVGCDEWHDEPAISGPIGFAPGSRTGEAMLATTVVGQGPVTCWWIKDGLVLENDAHYTNAYSTNLIIKHFNVADGGFYEVTVSNAFGSTTVPILQSSVHCTSAASGSPVSPYSTWGGAASTIQDAVDASVPGDVILVTNGLYASGGASNSVAIFRVIASTGLYIMSLNGPGDTIIEGQRYNPSSNIPPIACAWCFASMSGFVLRNGEITNASFGGAGLTGATASFCVISNNASRDIGGAVNNCRLRNCLITANSCSSQCAGCYASRLNNCTVTLNSAPGPGAGVWSCQLTNCIVYFNIDPSTGAFTNNYSSSSMQSSCSLPLPAGTGNIAPDPQLTDGFHLALGSPCRAAGMSLSLGGTDLDGDDWAMTPSMGCDEVNTNDFVGPLAVGLAAWWTEVPVGHYVQLTGQVLGRASALQWSFGDGLLPTNLSSSVWHSWTNIGDYTVTLQAQNNDYPGGVSTNLGIHVVPLALPTIVPTWTNSNQMHVSFAGQAGVQYFLEKVVSLAAPGSWQAVSSQFNTNGPMDLVDTSATNTAANYRVRFN